MDGRFFGLAYDGDVGAVSNISQLHDTAMAIIRRLWAADKRFRVIMVKRQPIQILRIPPIDNQGHFSAGDTVNTKAWEAEAYVEYLAK